MALCGLAALGATCKGGERGDNRAEQAAVLTPPPPRPAPIGEIEGVDITSIPPEVRRDALRLLNETFCYCGCARTLAACLASRADCSCVKCSERMTEFILNEYRAGASTEDVEAELLEGFSQGFNGKLVRFEEPDQPIKGPAEAPFTIVEFADFRCPHCAAAFEVLNTLAARRDDVQVRYFYYPLSSGREISLKAAEAAEEARHQGKFWELAGLMFENQHALEDLDLMRYARQVGLDMERFEAALKGRKHLEQVKKNKRLGESLGVQSTPTLFINGRPFGLARTLENLEMRLQMEAGRGQCD